MTNKLKWRLSRLPEAQEVAQLVKDKIITIEEARQILFSEEDIISKNGFTSGLVVDETGIYNLTAMNEASQK